MSQELEGAAAEMVAKMVENHLQEEAEKRFEERMTDHPHATKEEESLWLKDPESGQTLKPGDPGYMQLLCQLQGAELEIKP